MTTRPPQRRRLTRVLLAAFAVLSAVGAAEPVGAQADPDALTPPDENPGVYAQIENLYSFKCLAIHGKTAGSSPFQFTCHDDYTDQFWAPVYVGEPIGGGEHLYQLVNRMSGLCLAQAVQDGRNVVRQQGCHNCDEGDPCGGARGETLWMFTHSGQADVPMTTAPDDGLVYIRSWTSRMCLAQQHNFTNGAPVFLYSCHDGWADQLWDFKNWDDGWPE